MTLFSVRYFDRGGNGWTREIWADDLPHVMKQCFDDPDIFRLVSVLPGKRS